ncbi:prepilin-type N-terminal cleavage/methylation domain-containing protein [Bacillus sp. PS06]|uniref:prepilin-type N-terminal cleavage/methylation domain-containing protein n=1 Tax=Bacillus sp. PS06 TaxID=2764176 RepID=UPI001781FE12|nr:prepilin-type N-terminal cleavage/methylation domain-containing protein [Bacillus sp. PS06]MBD8068857.1 prepilin-type N-terminal cleavage/methylation domain-containing protein [Bacillus sp. PS06]
MNKFTIYFNQKGLTLIELLASIVIISIIIISFLSVFSQFFIFSNKQEDKLTVINLAEKVLSDVKDGEISALPTSSQPNPRPEELFTETMNGKSYFVYVAKMNLAEHKPSELELGLSRVQIKIYSDKNVQSSTKPLIHIYGYLK